jgi:hypothetical protein
LGDSNGLRRHVNRRYFSRNVKWLNHKRYALAARVAMLSQHFIYELSAHELCARANIRERTSCTDKAEAAANKAIFLW